MNGPRLQHFIHTIEQCFKASGIDNPSLDVRLLVQHALGLNHAQMLSQSERILTTEEIAAIEPLTARRLRREPVARILGEREFWSLPFGLNEATLEPRPDSETLVEAVLRQLDDRRGENLSILDLGTGTGCLLLALLSECQKAKGLGIDIAPRAIEQAKTNAKNLGLNSRAEFRAGNWLCGIDGKFDVIVSNPPYIAHDEIETLQPEVRDYDPRMALDGGGDGLDVYRSLIPCLGNVLKSKGIVAFEVGQGQAASVSAQLREAGFGNIEMVRDLGGIERVVIALNA